ncbi:methyl-accepting chemotaxis protein [Salinimonas iocasae]|uniref:Methyl-accepting chemotaxis protein n=1 Tax=Salinimonas iocasae TaxID=2572577 RepID=A0A5B7YHP9_9ALTE|nr:methyl-accepting chemotaxis protein [Salinimonas iocasae]QCZ94850.1 methyl-accepting chemotaxis protein [Salinimonas iocasae]
MNLSAFSIKQKLIFILVVAVLAATILVSSLNQMVTRDLIRGTVEESQLPNIVKRLANRVDKEVTVMSAVAHSIATNPDILAWSASGAPEEGEAKVVNYLSRLVAYNNLSVASFADRQTYNYWNHEGFLRTLKNDDQDGWFFAYKDSGQETSLSLYNDPVRGYQLYANYQQLEGRGMSGVAKTVDELVTILNQVKIAQTGMVFMVDAAGKVIAHPDESKLGSSSLAELTSEKASREILSKNDFALAEFNNSESDYLLAGSYIPSAQWYVIAQVPENELYAELNNATRQTLIWSLIVAAAFALVGVFFAASITRPLERLADAFQTLGQGGGDLTTRLPAPPQKEMHRLVDGFNKFIHSLHATMSSIVSDSGQVRQAASQVAESTRTTQANSQDQRDRTLQVATAMTQMASSVQEIARSAQSAAANAHESTQTTHQGHVVTKNAVSQIDALSAQISEVAETISTLNTHTNTIGGILDTIRGISEQTNLLALNAAIEAARAGDHGRGFSVVADEVRTLAQRAAAATDEIQEKIDSFQKDSQQAVGQMQSSQEQTSSVVESARQIDELLETIAQNINQINDMNTHIATATEQQASVVEDVSKNINEISGRNEDNVENSSQLVTASEQLDSAAENLSRQVGHFRL